MFEQYNVNIYYGRVGRFITAFESKNGFTGLKFDIYVGYPEEGGFWQNCVMYGGLADKYALTLRAGDFVTVFGKKAQRKFMSREGDLVKVDETVINRIMVVREDKKTKEEIEEEIEKSIEEE